MRFTTFEIRGAALTLVGVTSGPPESALLVIRLQWGPPPSDMTRFPAHGVNIGKKIIGPRYYITP
jgi:hypothetical protein